MPSAKTHDKITAITAIPVSTGFYFATSDLTISAVTTLVYLFTGFMFSGDLDIKSKPIKRWGILKFIWYPYEKIIKHRSIYSHGLFIGIFIRLLYLFSIFLIGWTAWDLIVYQKFTTPDVYIQLFIKLIQNNQQLSICILLAFMLGDLSHIIPDFITTTIKRMT